MVGNSFLPGMLGASTAGMGVLARFEGSSGPPPTGPPALVPQHGCHLFLGAAVQDPGMDSDLKAVGRPPKYAALGGSPLISQGEFRWS